MSALALLALCAGIAGAGSSFNIGEAFFTETVRLEQREIGRVLCFDRDVDGCRIRPVCDFSLCAATIEKRRTPGELPMNLIFLASPYRQEKLD